MLFNKIRISLISACLLVAGTVSCLAADYQMGIFPYMPPTKLLEVFSPMALDFSAKLGTTVRISTKPDYRSFTESIAKEQYDIAFIQPFDYTVAHDKHNYLPLAGRGEQLRLVIIVKNDSPIRKLSDLKGKVVANPPEVAAVSRLTSKALKDAGLNPVSDVKREYGKTHFSCAQSVLIGTADACGTAPQALRNFEKEKKLSSHFRVIHEAAPFPNSLLVIHKRVPKKDREKLLKTILAWPTTAEGQKIIDIGEFTPFIPIKDKDFNLVRAFLKSGN